jgi:hypothetical protein
VPRFLPPFPWSDLRRVRHDEACALALLHGVSRRAASWWLWLRWARERGVDFR